MFRISETTIKLLLSDCTLYHRERNWSYQDKLLAFCEDKSGFFFRVWKTWDGTVYLTYGQTEFEFVTSFLPTRVKVGEPFILMNVNGLPLRDWLSRQKS